MHLSFSKVLVTGGAGFIGSHLVSALVERGCQVTVLDNLTSGNLKNLEAVRDQITFVKGDIRDMQVLSTVCRQSEVVFHQAAVVSVTKTVEDPLNSTLVNEIGTLNVLESARLHGVRRVVLASSSAVYGDDPQLPKIESMALRPQSPYAIQKMTNEVYAQLYCRLYGLQTSCLRYFNVFGPRQDPSSQYSGVISLFMTHAARQERPTIYGDGRQTRDFVYVADVVQANLLAASQADASGQTFNIGTSHSIEINSLWQAIASLAECRLQPVFAESRPGDILHSLAGIQKARQRLGFEPQTSFNEGLRLTFAWYKSRQ